MNTQRVEETAEEWASRSGTWVCPRCDDENDDQIANCSKCGCEHPEEAAISDPAPLPDGAEVWDKDSIPFDVALEVVRRDMEKKLAGLAGGLAEVAFIVERSYYPDAIIVGFRAYQNGGFTNKVQTIDEIKFPSEEEKRAQMLASLREKYSKIGSELAKLEKEGV